MLNYKPAIATTVAVVGLALGGFAATEAAAQSKSKHIPMLDWEESLVKYPGWRCQAKRQQVPLPLAHQFTSVLCCKPLGHHNIS